MNEGIEEGKIRRLLAVAQPVMEAYADSATLEEWHRLCVEVAGTAYPKNLDRKNAMNEGIETPALPRKLQNCLVFAARYAHNRPTGAALMVTRELMRLWESLDENTKEQLYEESHEAAVNIDDWQRFRNFAEERGIRR